MRRSKIPFILLILMMIEIGLFIVVGGEIGVALTLAMIIVTSIIGSMLLRVQGLSVMNQLRNEIASKGTPARPMVHGFMIMLAGVLLLVPGFFTDALGFLLFVPSIRDLLWKFVGKDIVVGGNMGSNVNKNAHQWEPSEQSTAYGDKHGNVVDLDEDEYERKDAPNSHSDSPWRNP